MSARTKKWISLLSNPSQHIDASLATWMAGAEVHEISVLLREIRGLAPFTEDQVNIALLQATLENLPPWATAATRKTSSFPSELGDELGALYTALQTTRVPRNSLLTVLALLGEKKDVKKFCQLMLDDPPKGNANAAAPLLPFFRRQSSHASRLFPDLLQGLANPDLAPAILDLANFLTRQKIVASHPAAARAAELARLLEGIVSGLETLQDSAERQKMAENAYQRYSDSIALGIALCDALALIGDPLAYGVLRRLREIRHRRLRVEASAALARLGDEEGRRTLRDLAAEPSVRLRVLSYAEELGIADTIDERFREPAAVAEAGLVAFLSEPTVMGVPPSRCELIDSCTQYWPGYEEPRMCYLFRFTYRGVDAEQREKCYTNVGIAGPVVHAFQSDLSDLPNADVYAAFAGWHAEHEEIFETDISQLPNSEQCYVDALSQRAVNAGYLDVTALRLGSFFGEKVLVARARKNSLTGIVVVDSQHVSWHPQYKQDANACETAYNIYKGHRLLRAFND